jgi:streptogramin lyase
LTPTPTSVWHSIIYNVQTRQYEELAEATGVNPSTTGFALWTSELQPQPCPTIPKMGAEYVELWDNLRNRYEFVTPTMTDTTSTFSKPTSSYSCFNGNSTSPASYELSILSSFYNYLVVAIGCTITEFPIPTANSQAHDITTGPDGNLWFTEGVGKIGQVTPAGTFHEFPLPTGGYASGIAVGSDANLWFTGLSKVDKITVGGSFTEYTDTLPTFTLQEIAAGPDGNLWFTQTTVDAIGKITTSGVMTQYFLPAESHPWGITGGPDGNVWFANTGFGEVRGSIGKITPNGTQTEYPLPNALSAAIGITNGPDGNIWFTDVGVNAIGKVTTSGVITEYPGHSGSSITAGPDGNLWFTESNAIGKVTTTGVFSECPTPAGSGPSGITAGPDRNIWFVDQGANKIGKVVPP